MAQQQNTYLFALEAKDTSFIGATPERLLLGTKETFATACIAGTIKTGQTPEETKTLGAQLLQDRKNTGEHQIVVERLAKELAKMTTSENSIQAPIILENRDVQHLYVPISGQRKPGISFLESVMQLHPTPALGGEPKELAVEWIRQYEPGVVGYMVRQSVGFQGMMIVASLLWPCVQVSLLVSKAFFMQVVVLLRIPKQS